MDVEPDTLFDMGKDPNDYTLMPTTKKLGPLSGKYVERHIAADLNTITKARTDAQKLGRALMSEWKFYKVVASPAAHGRNMVSNGMLNWIIGGVSPARIDWRLLLNFSLISASSFCSFLRYSSGVTMLEWHCLTRSM